MPLAAFNWPPGWQDKGLNIFVHYDGITPAILARSPNVTSVVKNAVGDYTITVTLTKLPSNLWGGDIIVSDNVLGPPILYTTQPTIVLPNIFYQIKLFNVALAAVDGHLAFRVYEVPNGWTEAP